MRIDYALVAEDSWSWSRQSSETDGLLSASTSLSHPSFSVSASFASPVSPMFVGRQTATQPQCCQEMVLRLEACDILGHGADRNGFLGSWDAWTQVGQVVHCDGTLRKLCFMSHTRMPWSTVLVSAAFLTVELSVSAMERSERSEELRLFQALGLEIPSWRRRLMGALLEGPDGTQQRLCAGTRNRTTQAKALPEPVDAYGGASGTSDRAALAKRQEAQRWLAASVNMPGVGL